MVSVALLMDELAKIENLPETNPQHFAESQNDMALAMATQPAVFIALRIEEDFSMCKHCWKSPMVEAGISSCSERVMVDGCYGFAMVCSDIALVRDGMLTSKMTVMTMHIKNGSKTGAHA
ncbi:hypothetical protein DFH09DRAFT_1097890 [Mycena vulgaris]|nr:hypothetical protein DFH09DRAFT_1097890 [Mycena vulgaris]